MINPDNKFSQMQRRVYAEEAAKWTMENRDPVVGSWDAHQKWEDYDLLFRRLDTKNMVALDFGCGPGRMIERYSDIFKRIDGVDICKENIANARKLIGLESWFWTVNGIELDGIDSSSYDLIYSTICLQHIPVYDIRLNLFREFYRVLKSGGWFTAQMGYGETDDPRGIYYYDNKWDAQETNGGCDVIVHDTIPLITDLTKCGFDKVSWQVRPCGPNDWHPNWIFFRGQKER